jgi:hypothetical protein
MNSSDFRRDALSACGAFALLSACSGSIGSPVIAPTGSSQQSQTFKYAGATQTFTVPAGVTNLTIAATGASGAGVAQRGSGRPGGLGAVVEATIHVKPGQVLTIVVGGKAKGGHGGFNGGATGSYGGGGASDVRTGKGRLGDRIIVAGGGGGAGASYEWAGSSSSFYWCYGGTGGAGGANNGGRGRSGGCGGGGGAAGGSQGSGGDGGYAGQYGGPSLGGSPGCAGAAGAAGKFLVGGTGANVCIGGGGGGGGGYYGGGGGGSGGCCLETGAGSSAGGGGGGSSFVEKFASSVQQTPGGGPKGNGKIVIFWR